jgi:hypothetical protein
MSDVWYDHLHCSTVVKEGEQYIGTLFPDTGKLAHARPTYTEEDRARAVALGYGEEGVWLMHVEHELLHTIVSEGFVYLWSPVLYAAAHDQLGQLDRVTGIEDYGRLEECRVFAAQRLVRTGEPQPLWLPAWMTRESLQYKIEGRRRR